MTDHTKTAKPHVIGDVSGFAVNRQSTRDHGLTSNQALRTASVIGIIKSVLVVLFVLAGVLLVISGFLVKPSGVTPETRSDGFVFSSGPSDGSGLWWLLDVWGVFVLLAALGVWVVLSWFEHLLATNARAEQATIESRNHLANIWLELREQSNLMTRPVTLVTEPANSPAPAPNPQPTPMSQPVNQRPVAAHEATMHVGRKDTGGTLCGISSTTLAGLGGSMHKIAENQHDVNCQNCLSVFTVGGITAH